MLSELLVFECRRQALFLFNFLLQNIPHTTYQCSIKWKGCAEDERAPFSRKTILTILFFTSVHSSELTRVNGKTCIYAWKKIKSPLTHEQNWEFIDPLITVSCI